MTIEVSSSNTLPDHGSATDAIARSVLDALDGAVIVVRSDLSIRYRNAGAIAWLPDGGDLLTVLGPVLDPVGAVKSFDDWTGAVRTVTRDQSARHMEGLLQVAGRASPALVTIRCTPWNSSTDGDEGGALILIAETEAAEAIGQQLEVTDRLASLGKLAARVAHELNNPLDGILRYINLAMRLADRSPEPKLQSYLSESRTGLMRMVRIISDLLEYSRTSDGAFDASGVNVIVEQAINESSAVAADFGVIVAADFQQQDMPTVCGNRLYQVCTNLIRNAIDMMPGGGRLSVTTGLVDGYVIIRVADTGPGLSESPTKIFEPFYTTKGPGKGTGLGLAICKDFVEGMRGTIEASNGEDGGAVFTVTIPIDSFQEPSRLTRLAMGGSVIGGAKTNE